MIVEIRAALILILIKHIGADPRINTISGVVFKYPMLNRYWF